jgi:hypothetical protein
MTPETDELLQAPPPVRKPASQAVTAPAMKPVMPPATRTTDVTESLPIPPSPSPPAQWLEVSPRVDPAPVRYSQCPVACYDIPGFGPLLMAERGNTSACAFYLYPAHFSQVRVTTESLVPPEPPQQQTLAQAVSAALGELDAVRGADIVHLNRSGLPRHDIALPVEVRRWPQIRMQQVCTAFALLCIV